MTNTMTRPLGYRRGEYRYRSPHLDVTMDASDRKWSLISPLREEQMEWPLHWVGEQVPDYRSRIQRFAQLSANWDSYDASPFDPVVVARAKELVTDLMRVGIPEPNLIPASSGSIILEWWTDILHLEIDIDPQGEDVVFIELQEGNTSAEYVGNLAGITNKYRRLLNTAFACLVYAG